MKKLLKIGNHQIGDGCQVFIIAEIGINHNGDPKIAIEMIDNIADSGANCVKFQTFSAEEFVSNPEEIYEYTSQGKVVRESMLGMFKRLELERNEFRKLFEHAWKRGLIPLSTPTDIDAVDLLDDLGVGAYKIGSDDLVYTPFIEYVAKKGKPIIISTGMADKEDILRSIRVIQSAGNNQIVVLHCVSEYPTQPENVNLRKIVTIRNLTQTLVGFSDHSEGVTATLGAVSLGACLIEKHFTLDKNMPGPDHRFSADPNELNLLVSKVRELELCLGSDKLIPTELELEMAKLARRSIVAAGDLSNGHIITEDDLAYQRPGTGLYPYFQHKILGKKLNKSLRRSEQILFEHLED